MCLCPRSLALASSIPVLGLESVCPQKGCPWPWPRIFFVSLALASSLVSSTLPLRLMLTCFLCISDSHYKLISIGKLPALRVVATSLSTLQHCCTVNIVGNISLNLISMSKVWKHFDHADNNELVLVNTVVKIFPAKVDQRVVFCGT